MRHYTSFFIFFLLFGCTPEKEAEVKIEPLDVTYQDGIYKATYDVYDSYGWKPFVEIQVRGGIIGSANYDDINTSGDYKTQNQWYSDTMKKETGISPLDAANELVDRVVARNGGDVDTISGATITSQRFLELVSAALKNAQAGKDESEILFLNDTYKVEGDRDAKGVLPSLSLTFNAGKITSAVFNQNDINGVQFRTDDPYNETFKNMNGVTWVETVTKIENALILSQDPQALVAEKGFELLTELIRGLAEKAQKMRMGT